VAEAQRQVDLDAARAPGRAEPGATGVGRGWVVVGFGGAGGGDVVTTYDYDVQDHLTEVIDGEGNVTGYVYSDRDLMTRETSEVSGITEYVYNEHGELTSQTDARGITMERTVDELDRVTFVDYPTDSLDTTYVYDDPLVPFSLGRLTSIVRGGTSVDYEYDRFGRRVWFPY
jgi:YD repeat-containing protein